MLKLFSLSLSVLLIGTLLSYAKPVSAQVTFDDSRVSVSQDPNPVTANSGTLTITVQSLNQSQIFFNGQPYSFTAWPDGYNQDYGKACLLTTNLYDSQNQLNHTDHSFTAVIKGINPGACSSQPDKWWHFQLWLGSKIEDKNNGSLIVRDYKYYMEQPSGQTPKLTALNSPVSPGDKPKVNLNNARAGNIYSFWWDGAHAQISTWYKPQANGPANIEIDGASAFVPGENKTLCMEIGDLSTSFLAKCRYTTQFDFAAAPPPPKATTCSIIPSENLPKSSDASIKADNLPKNSDFRADLVYQGNTNNSPGNANSGANGSTVFILGTQLQSGDYTAHIYDSNDALVCEKKFNVSDTPGTGGGGPPSSAVKCNEKGGVCTSSAGQLCDAKSSLGTTLDPATAAVVFKNDPESAGVKTAIGCIPTYPPALMKGLIKFAAGAGGGIALLLMAWGAIQMMMSAGNPENLKKGHEQFTSAAIGLLIVILSVLLLQIIGVDILQIPGFK